MDIAFKKSQVQFTTYYKDTKHVDKVLCEKFLKELRESPDKFLKQFRANQNNPFMKGFEEA